MKLSVIIPVYKVEKTLGRCLNSISEQPVADMEIILVDDGSPDGCPELCDAWAERDGRIKVIHKANGGLSDARNTGMAIAQGDIITFVDSDDYVEPQYWETIDDLIERYHPDMLQWGFRENGATIKERNIGDYAVVGKFEVAKKFDEAIRAYMFSSLCARIFRMNIIKENRLRFDEKLAVGEDQTFIFLCAMHVSSFVSTSAVLYNVILDNGESLSRKKRENLTEQLMLANNIVFHSLNQAVLPEDIKQIYRGSLAWVYYRSAYSACKELLKYNLPKRERLKKITEICGLYGQKRVQATGIKCRVIAFPVVHKMGYIIDVLICRKHHRD